VKGTSLRAEIFQLDGSPMSIQRILEIMRSVCSALNYAHQQDMVHCDAKPGNILLEESGKVFVTDFGIARMTDAATATMVGMGTPAYMAPEQVRGLDPTPQTDIYSLGVILFEMLTGGERPFTGERATITGSTSEKVRWEQMKLDPPSLKRWNPEATPELDRLVLRCLAKEPGERYESTLEVLNELERALREEKGVPKIPKVDIEEPAKFEVEAAPINEPAPSAAEVEPEPAPLDVSGGVPDPEKDRRTRGPKRRWMWALVPAYVLLNIGIMILLEELGFLSDFLIPAYVMFVIAIPFFVVYIRNSKQWWPLIPGGIVAAIGLSFLMVEAFQFVFPAALILVGIWILIRSFTRKEAMGDEP